MRFDMWRTACSGIDLSGAEKKVALDPGLDAEVEYDRGIEN